jgi:hypothetical protein
MTRWLLLTALMLSPVLAAAQDLARLEQTLPTKFEESAAINGQPAASLSTSLLAPPPISPAERTHWIVSGTLGPESLGVGVLASAWDTAWDTPMEWERNARGFEKRYLQREADVAISSSLEAGLGAIWGEDPRYIPSGRRGVWPRMRWAMETTVLAPRRDGTLAPAWGRFAGNTVNNVIENAWLPPSATTWQQTALRSGEGMLTRLTGNLWDEFWPDTRRLIRRR